MILRKNQKSIILSHIFLIAVSNINSDNQNKKKILEQNCFRFSCPGLMLSVCVDKEMTAMMASLGIFYPILLLSGIVWPVQGMPEFLQ